MSARAAADAAEIEALLRDLGDSQLAQRARRQSCFAFSPRAIAMLLSFIVAPGCATAAMFLMTDNDGLLVGADRADTVLAKSDNLRPRWRTAEILRDFKPDVGPPPGKASGASSVFASSAIRGRIEGAVIETATGSTSPSAGSIARKQKTRRAVNTAKTPTLPAESAALNDRTSSPFERLFGLRVL